MRVILEEFPLLMKCSMAKISKKKLLDHLTHAINGWWILMETCNLFFFCVHPGSASYLLTCVLKKSSLAVAVDLCYFLGLIDKTHWNISKLVLGNFLVEFLVLKNFSLHQEPARKKLLSRSRLPLGKKY